MTKLFITSDLHFRHANILKYCADSRGHFKDVHEMDNTIINNWNSVVGNTDIVYILGDFAFTNVDDAVSILDQLKGQKILIQGNHDRKLVSFAKFRQKFISVHEYLEIDHGGIKVVMFHYPIKEWNCFFRGAVHYHGHVHTIIHPYPKARMFDVGIDGNNMQVYDLDKLTADVLKLSY